MPRRSGAIIPDPVDPSGTYRRVICIPASPEWIAIVNGLLYPATQEWYWDASTGDAAAAALRAQQMYFEFQDQNGGCDVAFPIGAVMQFGAKTPPAGWLLCDGRERLIADYPALYDVIGDEWGTPPSGSDYFVLPDSYNRSPYGWKPAEEGGTKAFASEHGAETHLLTQSQIPSHTHDYATGAGSGSVGNDTVYSAGVFLSPRLQTGATGGGNPHNNLHPVFVIPFIIYAGA
jgi:microcystin-dependent protein